MPPRANRRTRTGEARSEPGAIRYPVDPEKRKQCFEIDAQLTELDSILRGEYRFLRDDPARKDERPLAQRLLFRNALTTWAEELYPDPKQAANCLDRDYPPLDDRTVAWHAELAREVAKARAQFGTGNVSALAEGFHAALMLDHSRYRLIADHPDHGVSIPRWICDALYVLLEVSLPDIAVQNAGQAQRWGQRRINDLAHLRRFLHVKRLRLTGHKWDTVYEVAAARLQHIEGRVSDSTVKRSYQKVQRDPGRYSISPSDRFLPVSECAAPPAR